MTRANFGKVPVLLVALGCGTKTLPDDQVLSLSVCSDTPGMTGCNTEFRADGASTATVRVCSTVTKERRTDLTAAVSIDRGVFTHPKDAATPGVAEISFGSDPCGDAAFLMPLEAGYMHVSAELGGFHQRRELAIRPAAAGVLTLIPSILELTARESSSIEVAVQAVGSLGRGVTAGTMAEVEVVATPGNAYATVNPTKFFLDSTGAGKFVVYASPKVTSATVTVTASAPTVDGLEPVDPATATATFTVSATSGEGGSGGASEGPGGG
jgi:hypothetical protein